MLIEDLQRHITIDGSGKMVIAIELADYPTVTEVDETVAATRSEMLTKTQTIALAFWL